MRNYIIGLSVLALAIGCGGVKQKAADDTNKDTNPPVGGDGGGTPPAAQTITEVSLGPSQLDTASNAFVEEKKNAYVRVGITVDPRQEKSVTVIDGGFRVFTPTKEDLKDKAKEPIEIGKSEELKNIIEGDVTNPKIQISISDANDGPTVALSKVDAGSGLIKMGEAAPAVKMEWHEAMSFKFGVEGSTLKEDYKLAEDVKYSIPSPVFVLKSDATPGEKDPTEDHFSEGLIIDKMKPGVIGKTWSKPQAADPKPTAFGCLIVAEHFPRTDGKPIKITGVEANKPIDTTPKKEDFAKLPEGKFENAYVMCRHLYTDGKIKTTANVPVYVEAYTTTTIKGGLTISGAKK